MKKILKGMLNVIKKNGIQDTAGRFDFRATKQ